MAETDGADRIQRARLDKLERLEAAGIRGFPTTFARSHRAAQVVADFDTLEGQAVSVAGRVGVFKTFGKNLAFVFVQDGSGLLQLILHPRDMDEPTRLVFETLDPGDFVGASGTVTRSKTGEVSVDVTGLTFLSKSL